MRCERSITTKRPDSVSVPVNTSWLRHTAVHYQLNEQAADAKAWMMTLCFRCRTVKLTVRKQVYTSRNTHVYACRMLSETPQKVNAMVGSTMSLLSFRVRFSLHPASTTTAQMIGNTVRTPMAPNSCMEEQHNNQYHSLSHKAGKQLRLGCNNRMTRVDDATQSQTCIRHSFQHRHPVQPTYKLQVQPSHNQLPKEHRTYMPSHNHTRFATHNHHPQPPLPAPSFPIARRSKHRSCPTSGPAQTQQLSPPRRKTPPQHLWVGKGEGRVTGEGG